MFRELGRFVELRWLVAFGCDFRNASKGDFRETMR